MVLFAYDKTTKTSARIDMTKENICPEILKLWKDYFLKPGSKPETVQSKRYVLSQKEITVVPDSFNPCAGLSKNNSSRPYRVKDKSFLRL